MRRIMILNMLLVTILFSQTSMIFDHNNTDITTLSQKEIQLAKDYLHIAYGHTSHGSQIIDGMKGLVSFANSNGKDLSFPMNFFEFNDGGIGGALDLMEGAGYNSGFLELDCGYYPSWVNETTEFLTNAACEDVNVVMWSWCGQASWKSEQAIINEYLSPMTQFENDYPDITFVYMTGHSDGGGEEGSLHIHNQQIRQYCIDNNKVLFDFYAIECYDPDGNYYGDKKVTDNCDYDSDGNGSRDRNWATDWQDSHTKNVDWYNCGSAHSQPLNANQKAYVVWAMFAEIAKKYDPNSSIEEQNLSSEPNQFELHKCYPNPFNPGTNFKVFIPVQSEISLLVYNVIGEQVAEIYQGVINKGLHEFHFDGTGITSGIYFYKLQSKKFIGIERMVLMK